MGKGRAPCCDKSRVKRGPWSPAEDLRLITYIQKHGHENWRVLPRQAGLLRCGKSCRLRWINYLRPDLKRGNFTEEEEDTIIKLHDALGNRWSKIASYLPGRTDNEIKNVWNTHLKKRMALPYQELTKDSSASSSSSFSSSTTIVSCDKVTMGVEYEHGLNKGSHDEALRRGTCNGCRPTKEPNELSSSSVSFNNSTQVEVSNPENQFGLLLDFGGPYDVHTTTLDEVNKPGLEIPLEWDFDFWNMLDSLTSFQSNEMLPSNIINGGSQSSNFEDAQSGVVENRKWLQDLENELGLAAAAREEKQEKSTNS